MNIIGIDLGGTKIHISKFDRKSWKVLEEKTIQTKSQQGMETVIEQLIELIDKYSDNETHSIGIGVPGPTKNGIISEFPNIRGFKNFDLKSELNKKLSTLNHKPTISIYNDANCFTVGAWQSSKYKNKKNIIGMTLGTGVGGGIIANGKLILGENGSAGEFGHEIIRDGKTLEELVSGTALTKRWKKEYEKEKTGKEIVNLAKKGNKKALIFLENIGTDLGIAIKNIILSFNPEAILIGGSASSTFPYCKNSIQEILKQNLFRKSTKIQIERITNTHSATFGAAWLALKST